MVSTNAEHIIEVRGLHSQFGRQVVHHALDLDVRRGEVLGVIGGSGTGKSVLLRSIVGLRKPEGGSATVLGVDMARASDRERRLIEQRCGLLFQDGALFSSLTVGENIRVPLIEHHRLSAKLLDELVALKLRLVGLSADAAHKYPSQLSGGMRKRAGLARALALDPELLFLDEPTAGLDPIGAAQFDELILSLKRALNLTVFLVTHDLDSLYAICDRIAVLADRQVVVVDTPDKVENYEHAWVRDYFHGPRARAAQSSAARRQDTAVSHG
ncbi:ABC transporter ATP-binding protein [Pseudomarimonas arenosa]|uniref:ABC transporter ATP-binding protein n=1 Tax=Pseudomarimonas arenosa TaxID=2774145 RepID=A0AAW3ZMB2_9GAMM|nr:ABC transporter ATP-binding protein [Pseudomarimonas arenosa]MBD8525441.1 ABC transporter ATP-binding protein [Pseudomarimonas arenosa]